MKPFVLDPNFGFSELAALLAELGFERDESVQPVTPNALPGEPELAAWILADARLMYTLNPVVALRVISPAGVGDETRELLKLRLPRLDSASISRLLGTEDVRQILLGLLAARLLEARELAGEVALLVGHSDGNVAQAARSTFHALVEDGEEVARVEALRLLQVLCAQAVPVLAALTGPDAATTLEALRPRAADFPRVFRQDIASAVQAQYELVWREPPQVHPITSGELTLHVHGCPAGMFGHENELTRHFPGGYRALAPYLQTNRIWFVWRYVDSSHAVRMRYDGLVRIDDRWAWFPKPFRVVGELVRGSRVN